MKNGARWRIKTDSRTDNTDRKIIIKSFKNANNDNARAYIAENDNANGIVIIISKLTH